MQRTIKACFAAVGLGLVAMAVMAEKDGEVYQLEVKPVISEETILVTQFVITTPRTARLKLEVVEVGGHMKSTTTMSPMPNSEDRRARAKLTAFAAVSHTGGHSETHLFKVETATTRGGGPGSHTISRNMRLEDVLSLTAKAGEYKMGEPLRLGTFKTGPIILLVK